VQHVKEMANRGIRFVKGQFELAFGLARGLGWVLKEAVGQRTAQALVEEDEENRHFETLVSSAPSSDGGAAVQEHFE